MNWRVGVVLAVVMTTTGVEAEARARIRLFSTPVRAPVAKPALPANARPVDRGPVQPGLVTAPAARPNSASRDIPTGSVGLVPATLGVTAGAVAAGAATAGATAGPPTPPRALCGNGTLVGQGAGFCAVN